MQRSRLFSGGGANSAGQNGNPSVTGNFGGNSAGFGAPMQPTNMGTVGTGATAAGGNPLTQLQTMLAEHRSSPSFFKKEGLRSLVCASHAFLKMRPNEPVALLTYEKLTGIDHTVLKGMLKKLVDGGFNYNADHKANFQKAFRGKEFVPLGTSYNFENSKWKKNYQNEFMIRVFPEKYDPVATLGTDFCWAAFPRAIALDAHRHRHPQRREDANN